MHFSKTGLETKTTSQSPKSVFDLKLCELFIQDLYLLKYEKRAIFYEIYKKTVNNKNKNNNNLLK